MKLTKAYLLITLFLAAGLSYGQGSERKLLKKARKQLTEGQYAESKQTYAKLIEMNPSKVDYHFEAGLSYFNSEVQKEKSLPYFEEALRRSGKDTIAEIFLYLGKAYHYTHQFDKAIYYYNEFRRFLDGSPDGQLLSQDLTRYIEMCNSGIALLGEENKTLKVINLGERVNTDYSEYTPVVKQDETILIFTGRKSGSTGDQLYMDSKYFEDIYVSYKLDSLTWSFPTKFDSSGIYISSKVNTKSHDAVIGYNENETKLFIYRDKDVWQSELIDGVWSEPVRMNKNVNSRSHEPSVFITPDEQLLYVVSNRGGGFGGRDIYLSHKQPDGTWGPAENLGESINTPFDEDAPFLSHDGKTFFFSSKGHNSIGGYDIFKCEVVGGQLSKPVNLGLPLNSAGDDIFYLVSADNTYSYFSSSRMGGFGDMDIYRVQLDCRNIPNTEIRGLVLAGDKMLPASAKITITDKKTGNLIGTYTSDKYSGKYVIVLPPNNTYQMEMVVDGFEVSRPHTQEFTLPKQCEFFPLFQEINVKRNKDTLTNQLAQESKFKNAMFDVKTNSLEEFKIDRLPEDGSFLNRDANPDLWMALGGRVMHNAVIPGKGIEIFLVNAQNEIVRTTRTNEDGYFQFLHVDPKETYKILIDETDARLSNYGDVQQGSNVDFSLEGTIEKTDLRSKESTPVNEMPVYLVNETKEIVKATATNKVGFFRFKNAEESKRDLALLKDNGAFLYKIDIGDADQLFSSYIKTLDPQTKELYYTEFIDRVYLEKLLKEIPNFENIYFDFDRYFLRQKSIVTLETIATFMIANPDVKIAMDGHCDHKGTDEYNVKLSERRSNAAYNYLLSKGIDRSRMKQAWYGESKPAAANTNPDGSDNPDGRQLNRRVEFKVNIPDVAEFTFSF
ncbi:MAG: OmpA family protein [Flavobacteriales bacterium]|nr:OmpA family protein [Flavobacteriales bacterium]